MRRLYVDEGLSVPKVAEATGRALGTVRNCLDILGVVRRHQNVTEDEMAEMVALYASRLSMIEVAERTGRSLACVHRALHQAGVRINKKGRGIHPSKRRTPHEQVERIVHTYRVTRSQRQTARILGISPSTVHWHLTSAGEPLVPRSEISSRSRRMPWEREALICRLYREGVPVTEIRETAGVAKATVSNVVRRNGIPPRGRGGAVRLSWVKRRRTVLASAA